MGKIEMKVPSPGESISEVIIANWLVKDGDWVEKDQVIAEVDSDKATLELPAEASGIITLKAAQGDTVQVGAVVCLIDPDAARPAGAAAPANKTGTATPAPAAQPAPAPVVAEAPVAKASPASGHPSPAAAKLMAENNLSSAQVNGSGPGGRILKSDVLASLAGGIDASSIPARTGSRQVRRENMTNLRKKIAERLVSVKNTTAMLTTFNEVNMKPVMDLRAKYQDVFKEKHGVGLGFMSLFTKAVCEALYHFPAVNAQIQGGELIFHDYCDVGVA
ncbi:MAG: 2-oxo acid dehydrogenase subunit E2, partial [Bacteroidota bacterium]